VFRSFSFTDVSVCDIQVVATPLQVKNQLIQLNTQFVIRSCFYQLWQLRSIRRSLPTDARRTLAAAFIANRVDYCNGVLYGVSSQVIR